MKKKLFVLFCILLTGITFSLTRNGVELVYSYENLANKLYATDQAEKALVNYEKSLAINPNNEKIKTTIAEIKQQAAN